MARRTITGTLLGVAVLASAASVPSFTLVLLLVSLASLWEFAQLSARKGPGIVLPVAVFGVVAYILLTAFGLQHHYERPLLGATIILTVAFGLAGSRQGYLARCAFTLFGVLYIGWLGSYFIALRTLPHVGSGLAVASILLIATTDIFAMLVGTSIGRTPLSPISPRKTWEGAIGGFVASSALGAALGLAAVAAVLGGGVVSRLTDRPFWRGALRQLALGAAAAGVTYLIGTLVGHVG